ncbi:hypothetical protein, partial [Microvirga sp. KLBC 81]|uniref:hypothetical protein n=1 Tax=Microvirga sp. KLBC 81 TaxID=1862707 RepID=UPI00197C5321
MARVFLRAIRKFAAIWKYTIMNRLWDFIKEFDRPDPSEDQARERSWYLITVSVVLLALVTSQHGVFPDIMPAVICVALVIVFWRGERGIHPYNRRHHIGDKGHFLLAIIVFVAIGGVLLNSAPAKWYPTSSSYWGLSEFPCKGRVHQTGLKRPSKRMAN